MKRKTSIQIVPHNRLTFGNAECEAVMQTVRSGHWAQGPKVFELEQTLAQMAGVKHAVCVSSGLSALRLSLGALRVRASDRVVLPAYSCVALANAALAWDATPTAADVEPVSWNAEPTAFCRAITDLSPRAVILVNTFGTPAGMEEISATGVPIIEDCAHAFALEVGGKWLGSRGEIGVVSFYATKLIGGGEGGAVLTDRGEIADWVRSARDYSDQPADGHRLNDKMNELEAALVLAQLQRLPEMIAARRRIATRYMGLLADSKHRRVFQLPATVEERIWYRFTVEMKRVPAETVVRDLQSQGIYAEIPVWDWRAANHPPTAVADRAYRSLVSLPLYPTLSDQEQDAVIDKFLKLCEAYPRA